MDDTSMSLNRLDRVTKILYVMQNYITVFQ